VSLPLVPPVSNNLSQSQSQTTLSLTTPSKTDRQEPHTYDIPYACKEFTELEQQYSNWQDALCQAGLAVPWYV